MLRPDLSETSHTVLGLVSVHPGQSGHEIAAFAGRSIGTFFPVTRSHIFSELKRLGDLGMVSATDLPGGRLPAGRAYDTTAEGEAILQEWLEEAPVSSERVRNSFLVRIFFADRMRPGRLSELLDAYEREAQQRKVHLDGIIEVLSERPWATFRMATAMFGSHQQQAKLDWISEIRPLLVGSSPAHQEA